MTLMAHCFNARKNVCSTVSFRGALIDGLATAATFLVDLVTSVKHTGYQCECKPGYETTPTPNIKDTCAKPTTALKNGAAQAGLVSAAGMVAAMTLFM
jgi:hypothetical protein